MELNYLKGFCQYGHVLRYFGAIFCVLGEGGGLFLFILSKNKKKNGRSIQDENTLKKH